MKFSLFFILSFLSITASPQHGYRINISIKPFKNQFTYLGHYYGKTVRIVDSTYLDENSHGQFSGEKKLGSGLYFFTYPDQRKSTSILIDSNQSFEIIADTSSPTGVKFIGSDENTFFANYQDSILKMNTRLVALQDELSTTNKDSNIILKNINDLKNNIANYRKFIIKSRQNSFISVVLNAMIDPEIPDEVKASKDSNAVRSYLKEHYWDAVPLYDDRIMRTHFLEGKLDFYFNHLVSPYADSIIKEMDWMMAFANANNEMQQFTMMYFINRYIKGRYKASDEVLVHIFEKYLSPNKFVWLDEKNLNILTKRVYSIMSTVAGKTAADISLPDVNDQRKSLSDKRSLYTLLIFWDPTCSHCRHQLPVIDSLFRNKWKGIDVQIFAVAMESDGDKNTWLNFIQKHKLNDWTNVYYSKQENDNRKLTNTPLLGEIYNVQSFPTLYLLDKDKNIMAKKIPVDQVDQLLHFKKDIEPATHEREK